MSDNKDFTGAVQKVQSEIRGSLHELQEERAEIERQKLDLVNVAKDEEMLKQKMQQDAMRRQTDQKKIATLTMQTKRTEENVRELKMELGQAERDATSSLKKAGFQNIK